MRLAAGFNFSSRHLQQQVLHNNSKTNFGLFILSLHVAISSYRHCIQTNMLHSQSRKLVISGFGMYLKKSHKIQSCIRTEIHTQNLRSLPRDHSSSFYRLLKILLFDQASKRIKIFSKPSRSFLKHQNLFSEHRGLVHRSMKVPLNERPYLPVSCKRSTEVEMKRERLEIPESNSNLDVEKKQPEEDRRKTNTTLYNSIINIYVAAQLPTSPIMHNIIKIRIIILSN